MACISALASCSLLSSVQSLKLPHTSSERRAHPALPASKSMAAQPLGVYRGLLRAVDAGRSGLKAAFKGDARMLAAARQEIRSKFEGSRGVTDPQQQQQLLAEGAEAADFIRSSIVQAALNERGTFEMAIGEQHVGALVEEIGPDLKLPREKKGKKA